MTTMQYSTSTCFACGTENDFGLHLQFKDDTDGCSRDVSIPPHFQSYKGVVHGGIVATLLDAAMVTVSEERAMMLL